MTLGRGRSLSVMPRGVSVGYMDRTMTIRPGVMDGDDRDHQRREDDANHGGDAIVDLFVRSQTSRESYTGATCPRGRSAVLVFK